MPIITFFYRIIRHTMPNWEHDIPLSYTQEVKKMNDNGSMSENNNDISIEDDGKYEEEQRFIAERITELRTRLGVSESKLSYELGHNKNYIRAITVKHAMPSLRGLFSICEYFGMTPSQFFDRDFTPVMTKAVERMKKLDDEDMEFVVCVLDRLCKKK